MTAARILIVAIFTAGLAACGGGSNSSTTTDTSTAATTSAPAAVAPPASDPRAAAVQAYFDKTPFLGSIPNGRYCATAPDPRLSVYRKFGAHVHLIGPGPYNTTCYSLTWPPSLHMPAPSVAGVAYSTVPGGHYVLQTIGQDQTVGMAKLSPITAKFVTTPYTAIMSAAHTFPPHTDITDGFADVHQTPAGAWAVGLMCPGHCGN